MQIGDLEIEVMSELEAAFLPHDVDLYFAEGITVAPGDTLLDVGANVGAFSVAARQRAQGPVRVFAFEPAPLVCARLTENLARHLGTDGRAIEVALGARSARVDMTYFPHLTLLSSLHRGPEAIEAERARLIRTLKTQLAEGRAFPWLRALPDEFVEALIEGHVAQALTPRIFEARIEPLSKVLADEAIERVDLLKIDVEGAELDVLQGILPEDWPRIRQIVLEVEAFGTRAAQARARLEAEGFVVHATQDAAQRAGDYGMMYARRES